MSNQIISKNKKRAQERAYRELIREEVMIANENFRLQQYLNEELMKSSMSKKELKEYEDSKPLTRGDFRKSQISRDLIKGMIIGALILGGFISVEKAIEYGFGLI